MKASSWRLVALCATSGLAACDGEYEVPDDPCSAAPEIRAEMEMGVDFWTPDHEDALAARLVPGGFGGMYLEDSDVLAIVLVDPSYAEPAERQFRTALTCNAVYADSTLLRMPSLSVVVRDGEFDAIELLHWRELASVAFSDPDVTGLGINRMRNRIVVDVTNQDAVQRVEQLIIDAGVPRPALIVEP